MVPKSFSVLTRPRPKYCCQTRLTMTRAVRGLRGLVLVVQEGEAAVILLLLDGIELVIVALRAADGEAEPDGAGRGHAVEDAVDAELFLVDAALLIDLRVAMEAGGDLLRLGGVWAADPRELLDGELIKGHVRRCSARRSPSRGTSRSGAEASME
jgi:hypothetical protein